MRRSRNRFKTFHSDFVIPGSAFASIDLAGMKGSNELEYPWPAHHPTERMHRAGPGVSSSLREETARPIDLEALLVSTLSVGKHDIRLLFAMDLTTSIFDFVKELEAFSCELSASDHVWNFLFPDQGSKWHHIHVNKYKHTFYITHVSGYGGGLEVEPKKGVQVMDLLRASSHPLELHLN